MRQAFLSVSILVLFSVASGGERGINGTHPEVGPGPKKYAVIIGINQYDDEGIGDLKYAVADATAVHEALISAPEGFQDEHAVLLTDGMPSERHPTRNNVIRFLKVFVGLATPEDTVLVYFGGHGTTEDDKLILLPSDASVSMLRETAVPLEMLKNMLEDSPAKRKVLLLDACHSGAGKSLNRLTRGLAEQLEDSEGTVVLASCGAEELSYEMPETGHGAFTYFLLKGLCGEGDTNGDSYVGAKELSTFTWDKTRVWAANNGFKQNPWDLSHVSGDIVLAKVGAEFPTPPVTPTAKPLAAQIDMESDLGITTLPDGRRAYADGRFIDNGDGTVLDTKTKLVWQKADSVGKVGSTAGVPIRRYAKKLTLAGHKWRIPTKKEFQSLEMSRFTHYRLPFENSGNEYWYISKVSFGAYGCSKIKWSLGTANRLFASTKALCRCVTGPLTEGDTP